ncbi:hypothetical protein LDO26_14100 [Luteimonas sp. BDR2-5]|uniref:hypothetical protein n=1 Tax=Proluteimonas luteida TaxID=2878685 RepID=UPI001E39E3B3|nr:hypothetical protein [Luteimonas sp. BDR2-5]MCD9029330.1 hypothetical protein [Luteimonas sp. BDR2-5]
MLLRSLVVLLLILNLGVITWWATRGAPEVVAPVVLPADVPRLQLAGEVAPAAASRDTGTAEAGSIVRADEATSTAVPATPAPLPADPPQCHALGPFADAAVRDAAQARLAGVVVRASARDVSEVPRGWRVWMTPLADRAAANAMVARLVGAGFNDYYVIADGDEANGIALGRFGSEPGAESRARALRGAGFEVQTAPLGSVIVRHWLDVMAADGDTGEALRARVSAARAEPRDCNASRDAG